MFGVRMFRRSFSTPAEVETALSARPEYPETLSVEVTSACNLKCRMCALTTGDTRSSRRAGHMNEVVWERILEAADRIGHVNLNGWGENFLNPRFLDYMRELDARGVRTNFSTNGYFLTEGNVAELAAVRHLTHVNVSIDSPDPRIYEAIRGRPLAPAMRGLRNLVNGLPRPERVTVSSIVMPDNVESLAAFPELLGEIGVRGYVLQGLVEPENTASAASGRDSVAEIVARLGADCRRRGISVLVYPLLHHLLAGREPAIWHELPEFARRDLESAPLALSKQCASPWDHVFVNKDGLVMPCCNCAAWENGAAGEHGVMGDLKTQTFAEIWHGDTFSRFRTGLLEGDLPTVCRSCDLVSTGAHFFKTYAARLIADGCHVRRGRRVSLLVENRGCVPWTAKTRLRVGTVRPRDRMSVLRHPSWLNGNRAAEWTGPDVYPGKQAKMAFLVAPAPSGASAEHLKLVVDDVCWLPGTELVLESDSRKGRWRLRRVG